jgi:hypothetical protein
MKGWRNSSETQTVACSGASSFSSLDITLSNSHFGRGGFLLAAAGHLFEGFELQRKGRSRGQG